MADVAFCDLMCVHAGFPQDSAVDGSGSCRTFVALYCKKRKALVHKNAPCTEKKEAADKAGVRPGRRKVSKRR